jgi:hypothetical protein
MTILANDLVEDYLRWLKENITTDLVGNSTLEITTPFLDRHNDYIQIYVIENGDRYTITDDGFILSDLEISGMKFNTPKRIEELTKLLNRFGVTLNKDNSLSIECQKHNFASRKHSIMQAMLATNDLFVMSQSNVASLFSEDVSRFFHENAIRPIANMGIIGKTAYHHSFEYTFQASQTQPQRFIKLANNLNRSLIGSYIFAWSDTSANRPNDSRLFVVVNDSEKKPSNNHINALLEYDIKPCMWSSKQELLDIAS